MNLKISNTLSKKKELFKPINSKNITMYACGPTVYDDPHVGNARSLVVFDLLFRTLKKIYGDNNVTYVRNITDIDDKIIDIAKEKNLPINKITEEVTNQFHDACKNLNCLEPTVEPKATGHVDGMIKMTSSLIEKGFAYINEGHVYFSISSFKNYGKLSNKNLEDLKSGSRVEVSTNKKNPLDFVLWKPSDEKDPGWDSPWGRGRPGWHLECSVMSEKYLGKEFDIHGGGLDLVFPHHENEIAQTCSNNSNDKMANYWVHNGFLTMNKEKMSKSLGNIVSITDALKHYNGQVLRLALLSSHYKQPLDWNEKLLSECEKTISKWYESYTNIEKSVLIPEEYLLPLYDDLNTPGYIANLHKLFEKSQKGSVKDKEMFVSACNFIGLLTESRTLWDKFKQSKSKISVEEIKKKINERNTARNNKDYKKADKIRNELLDKGVLIEDKDDKTQWKFK